MGETPYTNTVWTSLSTDSGVKIIGDRRHTECRNIRLLRGFLRSMRNAKHENRIATRSDKECEDVAEV